MMLVASDDVGGGYSELECATLGSYLNFGEGCKVTELADFGLEAVGGNA